MALTKITGQVVDTTTDLVVGVTTVGGGVSAVDGFFSGIVTFSNSVSVAGTLTYEDVTNVDSVGLITARNGIVVGSGITLSKDGDIFFTGIITGNGSGLTGVANTDVIFTDKITLPDSAAGSINVGLSSDLQIYHDGSNSYISDTGTGVLIVKSNFISVDTETGETMATFDDNGAVTLYNDNSAKLATSASGVTVTGTVAATSYTGDGSSLSGISAGITTVDVRGGQEGNSHTLRIHNSGITTVGFSTYFLFPSGASPIIPTADGTISLISFTVDRQGAVGLTTQLLAGSSVNFS